MSTLKPYPEYKDSGVDWIGEIPTSWRVARVVDSVAVINGFPFDAAQFSTEGSPLIRIRDLNASVADTRYSGRDIPSARVSDQDILIGMDGDFNVGRWRGKEPALLNQRMIALRGDPFVLRLLESALPIPLQRINDLTYATTVKHLSSGQVRMIRFALPSSSQDLRALVSYLDRETAEIDAFIADQEELIALLAERRHSATDLITRKAQGSAEVKLKYLFRQSREDNRIEAEVLSVYRDRGVIPKASRSDNFNKTPEDLSRYLVVEPGYLVVNKMKAWQGSLGVSKHRGIVSPDYEVLYPISSVAQSDFIHAYLRSPRMIREYAVRSVGIRPAQWRLYWDQLGDLRVPLPPPALQSALVRELDHETAEIDAAIADAREAIALSRERRSALVSAAVTGKIDVRSHPEALNPVA